jgi:hypothetical protein
VHKWSKEHDLQEHDLQDLQPINATIISEKTWKCRA